VAREAWIVRWAEVKTPLGLPGQRQAVCLRTSYLPLREGLAPKAPEVRFYATDLDAGHANGERLLRLIRSHWSVENQLHHPKDRTWLEDRHWVKSKRTGGIVTMLRSVACGLLRKAAFPGLSPKAYCPERIEFFSQSPERAALLLKGKARL